MQGLKAGAAALFLCSQSTPSTAAVPEFGTPEGERGCVALMRLGLAGASASEEPIPEVVNAMAMAFGFYLGRLNKADPSATKQDIDRAMEALTLEEKNAYVAVCLKKAGELTAPLLK